MDSRVRLKQRNAYVGFGGSADGDTAPLFLRREQRKPQTRTFGTRCGGPSASILLYLTVSWKYSINT